MARRKKTRSRKPLRRAAKRRAAPKARRVATITVEFHHLRGMHGEAIKLADDEFVVRIHAPDKPLDKYLTFVHEIAGHIGTWLFTPFNDEKREHWYIRALEKSAKKHWRHYWERK